MTDTDKTGKTEPFLFNGGHLICPGAWYRKLHSHSFYQIIIIYRGCLTVYMNNKKYITHPGDVIFYPKNTPHKEVNEEKQNAEIIYLDWEGPQLRLPEVLHDRQGRIRILSEWLLSDYMDSMYAKQDEAENSMLQTLLFEIERNACSEPDSFVQNVKSLILDHISEPLSLDIISLKLKMNKFTFSRRYKKLTGHTPMEEVRLIRLDRARDLVISTDLSFNEIASKTGLTNEYHLSRIFKKYLEVPPGYFRKNH